MPCSVSTTLLFLPCASSRRYPTLSFVAVSLSSSRLSFRLSPLPSFRLSPLPCAVLDCRLAFTRSLSWAVTGLGRIGLGWTGLDWTGLDRSGDDRTGLDRTLLDWTGLDWTELAWTGLGGIGLDWIGSACFVSSGCIEMGWVPTFLVFRPCVFTACFTPSPLFFVLPPHSYRLSMLYLISGSFSFFGPSLFQLPPWPTPYPFLTYFCTSPNPLSQVPLHVRAY